MKAVKQYVMFSEWKWVLRDYGIGKRSEVKVTHSYLTLWPHRLYSPWNSPGQNTRVGSLSRLQGNFPTKGSNPGLPHCRWILYQLNHKGGPRILEWVVYPFSSGFSWSRGQNEFEWLFNIVVNLSLDPLENLKPLKVFKYDY